MDYERDMRPFLGFPRKYTEIGYYNIPAGMEQEVMQTKGFLPLANPVKSWEGWTVIGFYVGAEVRVVCKSDPLLVSQEDMTNSNLNDTPTSLEDELEIKEFQIDNLKNENAKLKRIAVQDVKEQTVSNMHIQASNGLAFSVITCDDRGQKYIVSLWNALKVAEEESKQLKAELEVAHSDIAILIEETKDLQSNADLGEMVRKMKKGRYIYHTLFPINNRGWKAGCVNSIFYEVANTPEEALREYYRVYEC